MRGEDPYLVRKTTSRSGSPPLARGRHLHVIGVDNDQGLTPACAGKTQTVTYGGLEDEAHPRLRGEDYFNDMNENAVVGSPPLARGRLTSPAFVIQLHWLTPACAGKTMRPKTSGSCIRAHPRLRGEDRHGSRSPGRIQGSPPLARGRPRL